MKRIKLTRGSARVSDDCPEELIAILDHLSRLVYMQNIEHVEFTSQSEILTEVLPSECEHKNIKREDGCDECLDCGATNC